MRVLQPADKSIPRQSTVPQSRSNRIRRVAQSLRSRCGLGRVRERADDFRTAPLTLSACEQANTTEPSGCFDFDGRCGRKAARAVSPLLLRRPAAAAAAAPAANCSAPYEPTRRPTGGQRRTSRAAVTAISGRHRAPHPAPLAPVTIGRQHHAKPMHLGFKREKQRKLPILHKQCLYPENGVAR